MNEGPTRVTNNLGLPGHQRAPRACRSAQDHGSLEWSTLVGAAEREGSRQGGYPGWAVEMEGSATAPIRDAHAWKCLVVKGGVPRAQRAYL